MSSLVLFADAFLSSMYYVCSICFTPIRLEECKIDLESAQLELEDAKAQLEEQRNEQSAVEGVGAVAASAGEGEGETIQMHPFLLPPTRPMLHVH